MQKIKGGLAFFQCYNRIKKERDYHYIALGEAASKTKKRKLIKIL